MPSRLRVMFAVLVVALLALAPQSADAFQNGRASASDLAPIFMPNNTAFLGKAPAASWNTMRLCAVRAGVDLYATPSSTHPARTAYRSYRDQLVLWRLYKSGLGNLAAYPGTSNHGVGLAIDLATLRMRSWIDNHGGRFGWSKTWSDAPSEWWHLRYRAGVWKPRPNPGGSLRYPALRKGSGGKCLADSVREVQRRLGVRQDGEFGHTTAVKVKRFQRRHHLKVNGVVASATWLKLRAKTRGVPERRANIVAPVVGAPAPVVGQDVKAVQGLLNARLVELKRPQYRVKVDGVLGHTTLVAVKRFQRLRHLPVTGKVDERTYSALRVALAKPTPKVHVSAAGARLVAGFEGFRSRAYRDAVGVWTVGYGHTGPDVFRLSPLSRKAGLALLQRDLDRFAKAVTALVRVPLTGPQYDALVSFSYNVGAGALRASTLLRELNHRHYRRAADQLLAWDKAGGRVLLGLHRRRVAERAMFLRGTR